MSFPLLIKPARASTAPHRNLEKMKSHRIETVRQNNLDSSGWQTMNIAIH